MSTPAQEVKTPVGESPTPATQISPPKTSKGRVSLDWVGWGMVLGGMALFGRGVLRLAG